MITIKDLQDIYAGKIVAETLKAIIRNNVPS